MDKFKSGLRRGVQTFKEKLGKTTATVDDEYDEIHERWQQIERASNDALLHINKLIENCHATATTIQFFSEDLKLAYSKDQSATSALNMLAAVGQEIEVNAVAPFQNDIHACVREQLATYCAKFSTLKELIEERKKLLLEYDYRRDKVHDLAEKKSNNPLDLPKAKERMNKAKEDYDVVSENLKAQMVGQINEYHEVFDPMIVDVSRLLVEYFQNMVTIIAKLKSMPRIKRTAPAYVRQASDGAIDSYSAGAASSAPVATMSRPPPPTMGAPAMDVTPPEFDFEWYYLDATNSQLGPILFPDLKRMYKLGQVSDATHVFGGEMSAWTQIGTIAKLQSILRR